MVKVGVVGLGFMGMPHPRVFLSHPKAELVAVSDTVAKRLEGDFEGLQGNFMAEGEKLDFSKLAKYETPTDMLDDPNVELVSVCLPTFLHADYVSEALAKGKHVLCEKPMGLSEEEVDRMVAADAASDATLMVGQCIRFWPEYRKAREIIQSGEIGAVRCARFGRRSALPGWSGWLADETRSGGMILDLSIHDVDFAHHLLGVPDSVRGSGAKSADGGFDHYHGTLQYGDVPVTIEGGWFTPGDYPFSMSFDIFCEGGLLSFDSGASRPLTIYKPDGNEETPDVLSGDGYEGEIDYLLECIESGSVPAMSPPNESALSVKLGLLLRESRSRNGAQIDVPSTWKA